MTVRVQTWVFESSEATGNDRLVLLALADEADDDGTNAYPSIERIARKARVNRATAIRAIRRLEEAGELLVERPEKHGRGRHNTYVLLMGRDPEMVALCDHSETSRNGRGKARKGAERRAQVRSDPKTLRPEDVEDQRATDVELPLEDLRAPTEDELFEEWWSIYPRKASKGTARLAYRRARAKASAALLLEGARRYAGDPNRDPSYTKHATTWLNGECWNDPLLPARRGPGRPQPVGVVVDEDRTGESGRVQL